MHLNLDDLLKVSEGSYYVPFAGLSEEAGISKQEWKTFIAYSSTMYRKIKVSFQAFTDIDIETNEQAIYFQSSDYISHLISREYAIEAVTGTHLIDVLNNVEAQSYVVISVKDDGSQAILDHDSNQLSSLGIKAISRNNLRHGYIWIGRKRSDGSFEIICEICSEKELEWEGSLEDKRLYVKSGGAISTNTSSIRLDGVELSPNKRGMNIVVFDAQMTVTQDVQVDAFVTLFAQGSLFKASPPRRGLHAKETVKRIDAQDIASIMEAIQTGYYAEHFRIFEVDIDFGSNGQFTAQDGWMTEIYQFMSDHPDMLLITASNQVLPAVIEKLYRHIVQAADKFNYKVLSRVIPQINSESMYEIVEDVFPFPKHVYSQIPIGDSDGNDDDIHVDGFHTNDNRKTLLFSNTYDIPVFRSKGYRIEHVTGRDIFGIFEESPINSYIVLSIFDEGSQAIRPEDIPRLRKYGIHQLSKEHLRHSYVNVINKTEEGYRSLIERVDIHAIGIECELDGGPVIVKSGGSLAGSESSILFGGREHSKMKRGINIAVIAESNVTNIANVDAFVTLFADESLFAAIPPGEMWGYDWIGENRLIGHALGGIQGKAYYNCKEGLLHHYRQGMRVFEADLIATSDDHLVARHDWDAYLYDYLSQEQLSDHRVPLSLSSFKNLKIGGAFSPVSFKDICRMMRKLGDLYIVTDTKGFTAEAAVKDFTMLADEAKSIDELILKRIIPQIYREEMYFALQEIYPFESYIYTLYQTHDSDDRIIDFVTKNGIKAVAMSETRYSKSFAAKLANNGIAVYIHTINDVDTAAEFLANGVHGFYTDFMTKTELAYASGKIDGRREGKIEYLKLLLSLRQNRLDEGELTSKTPKELDKLYSDSL